MYVVFIFSDERENPEDFPEHELKTRGDRVISINYSFLWQHLEPSLLLSILVDKLLLTEAAEKEAKSYAQKFTQNAVIINQLLASDCPPLKLCDTLDVTGQEHIARKLLQGTHCVGCIYQNCFLSFGLCTVFQVLEGNNPIYHYLITTCHCLRLISPQISSQHTQRNFFVINIALSKLGCLLSW